MRLVCVLRTSAAALAIFGLGQAAQAAELTYGYWQGGSGPDHTALAAALPAGDTLIDQGVAGSASEGAAAALNRLLSATIPPAVLRLETDARARELVSVGVMTALDELAAIKNWPEMPECKIGDRLVCVPVSAGEGCVSALFFPIQVDPAIVAAQYRLAAAAVSAELAEGYPAPECVASGGR